MPAKPAQPRSAPVRPSINVTPLIDVLLVLLIMFMVIQPHNEMKLPVRAPQPQTDPPPAPSPDMLMLTVASDFQLALNTTPVTIEELLPLLSSLMEQRPTELRTLFIKAPAGMRYESVVLLIDLAKGSGVVTVGLVAG